jgi:putative transposase
MQAQGGLTIERMCHLGRVSRAGFYRYWQQQQPGEEAIELRAQIQQIVLAHRGHYGYRRVSRELNDHGVVVNHKRVLRLMREDNLLAIRRRKFLC